MSKSLNNFITIRDLLKDWDSDVFRFFVLSTHYRSPIDFSTYSLHQSEKSLNKIKKYFKLLNIDIEENKGSKYEPLKIAKHEFFEAMDNDFNTPKAISAIFNLINKSKGEVATLKADDIIAIKLFLLDVSEIFGIDFNIKDRISSNDDLLSLIFDIRQNLRENKQYELSDKIREELNSLGYEVKD